MKLTFIFTDSPEIQTLPKDDIYNSYFELPTEALNLPNCRERVLEVASLVGQLTNAALHLSCKELGFKNHPVKLTSNVSHSGLRFNWRSTIIHFDHLDRGRAGHRELKIRLPVDSPVGLPRGWQSSSQQSSNHTVEQLTYLEIINQIANICLELLNSERLLQPDIREWTCRGFHPFEKDPAAINRYNKRSKREGAERRRRERQEQKQKEKISRPVKSVTQEGQTTDPIPKTGAGRRPGAVPGVFKGIQFRSQLEIRFATQLEAKQIRWVYETERLGEGNYLVDFYLPDYKCWVEVKGRFEPRDDFLLPQVAVYLERERSECLYVYTQTKAFAVKTNKLKQLSHDEFWSIICK